MVTMKKKKEKWDKRCSRIQTREKKLVNDAPWKM